MGIKRLFSEIWMAIVKDKLLDEETITKEMQRLYINKFQMTKDFDINDEVLRSNNLGYIKTGIVYNYNKIYEINDTMDDNKKTEVYNQVKSEKSKLEIINDNTFSVDSLSGTIGLLSIASALFIVVYSLVGKNDDNSLNSSVLFWFQIMCVIFFAFIIIATVKNRIVINRVYFRKSFNNLCILALDGMLMKQNPEYMNKIQYNGCNWIGSKEVPDFIKEKNNNVIDIGLWVRFIKEFRRLIGK